ncbi:hypothetical protein EXIGLDRAFT_829343 [Exidia glandulosa HHB12029]|uniref:F-box domain-containing protein n=1 Tax=Exidia glandulosa HHB12029 TaxID=1314781 RepID=A0A165PP98_EXIGL|nr:hypothetical protein EXIGLDRAFT_829343 [Exidia glandulosa HHB12029]
MADVSLSELGSALSKNVLELKSQWSALDAAVATCATSGDARKTLVKALIEYEAQLNAFAVRTKAQHNALSLVNRLSPEVLCMIFREATESFWYIPSVADQIFVTHVCRKWRAAALDDPHLWRAVRPPAHAHLEVLQTYLRRAKQLLVTVKMSFFVESKPESPSHDVQDKDEQGDKLSVTATTDMLKAHAHQLSEFELRFREWHFDAVTDLLSVPFPNLVILHLEHSPRGPPRYLVPTTSYKLLNNDFTASLSGLTSLTLVNIHAEQFAAYPLTRLTDLDLRGSGRLRIDAIARVCSLNPALTALTLGIELVQAPNSSKVYQWPVSNLEFLSLEDSTASMLPAIYRRVDFPSLARIDLKLKPRQRLGSDHLLRLFTRPLKATSADITSCGESCDVYFWSQHLTHARHFEAENMSLSRAELLNHLALDFRLFRYLTDLTINPCLFAQLAEVVESAPLRCLTTLTIIFHPCHNRAHPRPRDAYKPFDASHVRLGAKALRCPALTKIDLYAELEDHPNLFVTSDFLISLLDLIDHGETKLKTLCLACIRCPVLQASGSLNSRAEKVEWDCDEDEDAVEDERETEDNGDGEDEGEGEGEEVTHTDNRDDHEGEDEDEDGVGDSEVDQDSNYESEY